jgi:hypothetical protein
MPNTIASLRPDVVSIHLRLPKSLHRRLVKEAKTNRVALNTEIVNQLEGRRLAQVEDFKATLREFFQEYYALSTAAAEKQLTTDMIAKELEEKFGKKPKGK